MQGDTRLIYQRHVTFTLEDAQTQMFLWATKSEEGRNMNKSKKVFMGEIRVPWLKITLNLIRFASLRGSQQDLTNAEVVGSISVFWTKRQ